MFKFLKPDPKKQLEKQYQQLTEKAFKAQRNGDIRGYSGLTAEAEKLKVKIDELESE